jgi:hypothetical protein
MEKKLTIRIPSLWVCEVEGCFKLSRYPICNTCYFSNPRVREEMSPAALTRKAKIIHSPALSCDGGRLCKIY